MFRKESLALLAACAALTCGGLVQAADNSSNQALALDDAPATVRKPLMAGMDAIGAGKTLDNLGININGYVEGSYTFDFNHPTGNYYSGRDFDNEQESVLLNQVELNIARAVDASKGKFDIGFTVEQIYGTDAALMHANGLTTQSPSKIMGAYTDSGIRSPKNQYDLTQAFLTFAVPVGKGLTLTVGKFDTLLGYEVTNPTGNIFYSHSLLFTQLPFTQTGVLAAFGVTDNLTLTAGVTRGWDAALKDVNGSLGVTGQIKYVMDKWSFYLNGDSGNQQPSSSTLDGWRTVLDFTAQYAYADNLSLALNADYGIEPRVDAGKTGQWYGVAAYAQYTISPMFALGARGEWFNDPDGAAPASFLPGTPNQYYELTLGVKITPIPNNNILSNLVIRPEIRCDYADKATWAGDNSHDQLTAAVEAYFAF